MANLERLGEIVSSLISGRVTMNTVLPPPAGDHPLLPRPPSSHRRMRPATGGASAGSDAAALAGTAPVVRDGRHVLDAQDLETRRRQRPDGRLPARPRALDVDVDLGEAVLLGPAGRLLRGELRREWRGLAGALEPHVAGARPGERVAVEVGDRDDRVVERRLDVGLAVGDVLLLLAAGLLRLRLGHGLLALLPPHAARLLRSLAGPSVRVGPLAPDRQAAAVPPPLVRTDLPLPLCVLRHAP